MNNTILSTAILCSLAAAGCRNAKSTCEETQALNCEFTFHCCEDDEIHAGGAQAYVTSEGECKQRAQQFCEVASFVDESVAAGRAEFNAELASKCIDQMKQARDKCDRSAVDDECFSGNVFFVEGTVKDGDTCANSFECADQGDCEVKRDDAGLPKDVDGESGTVEGECKALPGKGDDCPDFSCQEGLYCDFTDSKCKEQKKKGDACTNDGECESFTCDLDSGECAAEEDEEDPKTCNGRK